MNLIHEKIVQAQKILEEKDIDLWLTFVRETTAGGDPVLSLIYGHDLTWQSALVITSAGKSIAIVGHFESDTAIQTGAYDHVIGYHQSIRQPLLDTLTTLNPAVIAINYSKNDVHSDGLGHGLYQVLLGYLSGTPFSDRLISAETVTGALRSRKTDGEIFLLKKSINETEKIYADTFAYLQPGMTEEDVAAYMLARVDRSGYETAWERAHCPAVNAGPDSPVDHSGPTDIKLARGQIVHFDFGVIIDGYCSDIQRVVYLLKEGETQAPEPVRFGFETISTAVQAAAAAMKPGVSGFAIDQIARKIVTDGGFPEYMYATGHHLGRTVHDGAGILGPKWERYGDTPNYLLEAGHVYTLEPGAVIPGYGYIGLEEDVLVTDQGAVFLSKPQTKLILK